MPAVASAASEPNSRGYLAFAVAVVVVVVVKAQQVQPPVGGSWRCTEPAAVLELPRQTEAAAALDPAIRPELVEVHLPDLVVVAVVAVVVGCILAVVAAVAAG